MSPKVTINLLGWNSKKYLKQALDSVMAQTYPNLEVVFIDNGSEDDSVSFVRQNFSEVKIIENKKNFGYAEGHNIGIRASQGKYIICMNPDIIMEDDFVSRVVEAMNQDDQIGVAGGKLLKMEADGMKTNILDSTGFKIFRSRRVIDRGSGEEDQGQYEKQERVFGVSGALSVFRKKALEDTQIFGEYFDCDFENYKEDIDLCWRLNLYGWKCVFLPAAIAYHERGTGLGEKVKLHGLTPVASFSAGFRGAEPRTVRLRRTGAWAKNSDFLAEKKKHSFRAKYFSFKNHSLMLVKNDFLWYYLLDLPFILFYEIKRWGYVLLAEPRLVRSFFKLITQIPSAFKKRRVIMEKRRIKAKELRNFFR